MTCEPQIGRDLELKQLRHLVEDEKVPIIGIHGMGGVGKTGILRRLNNEFLVGFQEVIWLSGARSLNVEEIQKCLGVLLGLPWEGKNLQIVEQASILHSVLSKMKIMLILDGLWEPLDLKMVGIPAPHEESGSKVILTTRLENVCDLMDATKIKVECLNPEESWDLFQYRVGNELIRSNFLIRECAKKLVKQCYGLPLALTAIGLRMASKKMRQEWKYAVTSLNTRPWRVEGMEKVLQNLKLSYEELHDSKSRTCLLYASLLEENIHLYEEWIVDYCIGEGVIDDFDSPEAAYETYHNLFGRLKEMSLLEREDEKDYLKMHPMIRNMVIWIESEYGKQEKRNCWSAQAKG